MALAIPESRTLITALSSQLKADGPSSETRGQIVGVRESLNGRENMAGRKVKNGEKSP